MEQDKTTSADQDRFVVRLNSGMREMIHRLAKENNRSMNSEILFRLQKSFDNDLARAYQEKHGVSDEFMKQMGDEIERIWPAQSKYNIQVSYSPTENVEELMAKLTPGQQEAVINLLKTIVYVQATNK